MKIIQANCDRQYQTEYEGQVNKSRGFSGNVRDVDINIKMSKQHCRYLYIKQLSIYTRKGVDNLLLLIFLETQNCFREQFRHSLMIVQESLPHYKTL